MKYNKVKGTTDFFPEEKYTQNQIFDKFSQTALLYNFKETETPALESMNLLTRKSGPEIKSQIFVLEKRSIEELGLRFEFTASLARMFISCQKQIPKPVKWFSMGRVWRYEQPQAGRQREFYQYDAEIFGSSDPECDIEIVNLAIDSLRALGLSQSDFFVNINNRKLLQGLLEDIVPKNKIEDVLRIIDKRSKISRKEFLLEMSAIGKDKSNRIAEILDIPFNEFEKMDMNETAQEGYNELGQILAGLDQKIVRFDLSTARGLAYYTGTVFEIFDTEKKFRALCGGGRYDDMIEVFGGQSTPATGFGMGYSTVSLLLKDKGLLPKTQTGPDYFIAKIPGTDISKIVKKLRKKYTVDFDLNSRNLGNQLKYANTIKAKNTIVIGPDELKSGIVKVKDMKTGSEKSIDIKKL